MEQLQVTEKEMKKLVMDDNSSDTQQELLALLGKKRKSGFKKYLPLTAVIALLLVGLIIWRFFATKQDDADAVTYRQYTVQRGNVVVGTTESSSISLERETIKFPVSTTVEKIFVKAGQSVKEGDPLMQLNLDEINAGLVSYQLQVKMAELELEQEKLDQQSKQMEAEQTYKTALLKGQLAESNQNVTVTELEKQLADAQEDLEDALEDLNTYQNYEDNYDDDYSDLQSLAKRVATYKALYQEYYSQYEDVAQWEIDLATYQKIYAGYVTSGDTDSDEAEACADKIANILEKIGDGTSTALYDSYEDAYETYQTYSSKYADRLSDFNDEYDIDYDDEDELEDKIADLKEMVEKYNIALETAKLEQQTGSLTAEQTKQLTELSAQTAEAQYNLNTLQLSQSVDEAQETYDQTVRQINNIEKSISDDGIVYAPCTGMIVSISLDEGDDFDVTYDEDTDTLNEVTLLTMADISSVYVPITVSEEDILDVYIGQPADVTMSAFEGKTFDAQVDTISVVSSRSGAATVTYTVNVKYNGENTLDMYDGMSAETTLLQRTAEDVLYINNQAVTNTNGIATVQKLGSDGNAVTTRVKTGFSNGQYVEITDGLEEGDIVLAASGVSNT